VSRRYLGLHASIAVTNPIQDPLPISHPFKIKVPIAHPFYIKEPFSHGLTFPHPHRVTPCHLLWVLCRHIWSMQTGQYRVLVVLAWHDQLPDWHYPLLETLTEWNRVVARFIVVVQASVPVYVARWKMLCSVGSVLF
jgi:hypothetical protein